MTVKDRSPMALKLAAALLFAVCAGRANALTYKASIISPTGYAWANVSAISGNSIVGGGYPSLPGDFVGFLLDDSTRSVVNLSPAGWGVTPADVSGDSQVGSGTGPTTGGQSHAVLWHGTAASMIDLHPASFHDSSAQGVFGNTQAGFGFVADGSAYHALVWHGTADSFVDLNPDGFVESQCFGVVRDTIVGFANTESFEGKAHAMLWHDTAASAADLHPAAFSESIAFGVSQDSQVGVGLNVVDEGHALLWHGTAASVIDLNPAAFTSTEAVAVTGNLQVGFGSKTGNAENNQALLWQGTAASVVELHTLLAGLGHTFATSYATDIDQSGVIVGYATEGGTYYAVKWTPIVPGDFNGNGIVDAADYVVWRKGLGTTYTQTDYDLWRAHFGETAGGGSGAGATGSLSTAVREPSSAGLLLAATAAGAVFRIRVRRSLRYRLTASRLSV